MSAVQGIRIEDEPAPRAVTSNQMGALTHLAPKGLLLSENQQQPLIDALEHCLKIWNTQVIIDLSAITLLNSRNIEMLLRYQARLVKAGGWLKLANTKPLIRDILRITAADEIIPQIDNVLDAKSATREPDPSSRQVPVRLGDLLVKKGLLDESRIEQAIQLQKKQGKRLGQIVVDKGWVSEHDFLVTLSEQLQLPYISLRNGLYDPEVFPVLERDITRRLNIVPLFMVNNTLSIATADPQAIASFSEIEDRLGCRVRPVLARREDIVKTLSEGEGGNDFGVEIIDDLEEDFAVVDQPAEDYAGIDDMAAGSPVINMVNSIIQRAVHDKASDIHIEPSKQKCRIRFRIDGLLYEVMSPRIELHPALVSRLKVMANLDIAERRMPQDGRIQVHTQGRSVDLRFSSLPGLYGEKVVLRVLDKNATIMDVSHLGMQAHNQQTFINLLGRSYGLILVTGPTGSGKTTSLYSAINYINSIEKNIVTIEDPVEYQLDIVNQNPVRENIGLTFAKMLKHVLRQDPDVVMVGEIRERETAEIAVQAALTGHLVLSTLHTNDSIGAVTRMLDMGIEPYLLSSALIGVVAQRLVRSICPNCKTEYLASPEIIERFHWQDRGKIKLSKGRGCNECYDSGYRGRLGIHEILEVDHDLQKLIIANPSRDNLTDYLDDHQIKLLFDDGLDRALEGKTTIEEISRVINS